MLGRDCVKVSCSDVPRLPFEKHFCDSVIRSFVESDQAMLLDFINIQLTVYEAGPCQVMKGDRLQPPQNWDNQPHSTPLLASVQG